MAEIRNPNQQGGGGGGQESKTILMFTALFIVILFGMQYFREKKAPQPTPAQHQQTQTANNAQQPATPAPPTKAEPSAPQKAVATPPKPVAQASDVVAKTQSTTVVENELYRITFSNRGAQVTSWVLKKYTDNNGKPLDLVNQKAAAKYGYPLSLY
ncbi:MAG TPA: membrane protein insertase YidC, partial [Acidobacteriaceae bacterium]|nr:membrane protein insertase YidC [Acidobacteriaceae bacterium]